MNRLDRLSKENEQITAKLNSFSNTVLNYTSDDLKSLKSQFSEYMAQCDSVNAKQLIRSVIDSVTVGNEEITVNLKEGIAVTRRFKEYVQEPLTEITITLFLHNFYMDSMRHKLKCWFGTQGCNSFLTVSISAQKIGEIFGNDIDKMVGKFFNVIVKINSENHIRKVVKLEAC